MAKDLSPSQCVLLAVHYASEGNIRALHSFTPTRLDALDPELVLRILVTYLPESIDPREYTTYVREVASRLYLDIEREDVNVDISPVKDMDEAQAKKAVKRLYVSELHPPSFPPHAPKDALTRFLCHRAYRIDAETGLLNLIPQLIEPFLTQSGYLRTWYISVVLPLLRLEIDYYPEEDTSGMSLDEFEKLEGTQGTDFLLQRVASQNKRTRSTENITRDIKGLVGPWMYGHMERKRRKLGDQGGESGQSRTAGSDSVGKTKIALDGVQRADKTGHDWEHLYRWLIVHAREQFPLITQAIDEWEGPGDVDLGGFNPGNSDEYLEPDIQKSLEAQYAQAAFASCYAVTTNTQDTIHGAHQVLARLAELLDFIPPPDLATSVESLPKVERHAVRLDESHTMADLDIDALLKPEHPLTTPRMETYMLLQMMVYSAYQFSGLGYPVSIINVAKLHYYATAAEQLSVLQKILLGLATRDAKRDDLQWTADRSRLMWLWSWGLDHEDGGADEGAGVIGKISREQFEEMMLSSFIDTGSYHLALNIYLKPSTELLSRQKIEAMVTAKAMEAYDGASNGNKTRGGVRKANDIIAAFRPYFTESIEVRHATALIAATHALSFYALTLQHGVPFQPVNIRVSKDPISLINKVLEQNPRSYTQLDDLLGIGRNFVSAGLLTAEEDATNAAQPKPNLEAELKHAERRVTFMAVEAALREDDFETAYSYIVNRLTPSGMEIEAPQNGTTLANEKRLAKGDPSDSNNNEDDVSWRAAFLAGRFRPATSSPPTLRRLEQRIELLSLALLLAPASVLTDILAVWRRCEEESTALVLSQQQSEQAFDDMADKRLSNSSIPGNFTILNEQPDIVINQKRREIGRMSSRPGVDEAPVSMFDLTRSAAQAFSKNAFPLRGVARSSSGQTGSESGNLKQSSESLYSSETGVDAQQRVRKRDMVASAASGALASGLGWVLGATPASQQVREE